MNDTTNETRLGLTMTHSTRQDCQDHPSTQLWIEWAERHGFQHRISRREYYNLPARGAMESYRDTPTESRYYWELHVVVGDPTVYQPNQKYMHGGYRQGSLDDAIAMSRDDEASRVEAKEAGIRELVDHRDAILESYGRRKVYPRSDMNYRWECLRLAIRDALPMGRVNDLISHSSLGADVVMAALDL